MIIENCPTFFEFKKFISDIFFEQPFLIIDSKSIVKYSLNGGKIDCKINLFRFYDKHSNYISEINLITWSGGWEHRQSYLNIEYDRGKWIVKSSIYNEKNKSLSKRSECEFDTNKDGVFIAVNNFLMYLYIDDIRNKKIDKILNI